MGVKSWVDRKINLTANTILNHRLGDAKVNVIIINNPTDSEVFASLDQNVSASNYEARVPGKLKGMIIRSSEIRDVYLLCASTVTGIQLHEVLVDDPLFVYLLESVTGSVVVSSTTGLKASELNIDPTTKNLNVQTGDTINIASIEGKDAHDAPSTGKPVQVGGVRRVSDPALADGDIGSLRLNAKGEAIVELSGSTAEIGNIQISKQNVIIKDITQVVTGLTYGAFGNIYHEPSSDSGYVDVSKYARREVWVFNNTDKAVKVTLRGYELNTSTGIWNSPGDIFRVTFVSEEILAAGAKKRWFAVGAKTDVGQDDLWKGFMYLLDWTGVTPVTGSVRVVTIGRMVG